MILISGNGSNLQAIIDAISDNKINVSVAAVISNKAEAYGLERARKADITDIVIDHNAFDTRELFDQALASKIDAMKPDLVVLAGFMRILSKAFIDQYEGKIINIHPSLLPKHKGLHTHRRVLEACEPVHGASVHFVNNELDSGPVVIQAEIDVNIDDTENTLAQRVHQQEHIIYPLAIQWFVTERLQLNNNQLYFDRELLKTPIKWKSNTMKMPEETA